MKTEAAILVEAGRPLELAELEIPSLKQGQVLVEIRYSGACRTQLMEANGHKGEDKYIPHCLGHEASGTVLEVGPSVTKVKSGDEVVVSWIKGIGIEAGGCVYDWGSKRVNAGGCTTFQRHTVASENRLTLVPPSLPLEIAAMLGCPTPTGMGAALNVAGVRAGDTVAVFGTGGIGLNASMAAAFSGASILIGVDPSPDRRALAQRFGATHTIDPGQTDPVSEIKKIVPAGVDIAIEATGITAVMQQAVSATRSQGGRAIIVGNARHGSILEIDPIGVFNQGKSLMGTWGGDSVPDRDYGRFGRILASGRFPVRELLSKPYSLIEINQALADLSEGKVGRPLIDMALT